MSHVRMCDKCYTVFSELEDGWQTFQATTMRRDENGEAVEVNVRMDACPSCSLVPRQQFTKEVEAAQAGRELDARIARLERESGIDPESGTFVKQPSEPVASS